MIKTEAVGKKYNTYCARQFALPLPKSAKDGRHWQGRDLLRTVGLVLLSAIGCLLSLEGYRRNWQPSVEATMDGRLALLLPVSLAFLGSSKDFISFMFLFYSCIFVSVSAFVLSCRSLVSFSFLSSLHLYISLYGPQEICRLSSKSKWVRIGKTSPDPDIPPYSEHLSRVAVNGRTKSINRTTNSKLLIIAVTLGTRRTKCESHHLKKIDNEEDEANAQNMIPIDAFKIEMWTTFEQPRINQDVKGYELAHQRASIDRQEVMLSHLCKRFMCDHDSIGRGSIDFGSQ
ncbi:hypothetical protein M9H77_18862 [Catharanthus roseus]|uniref:Uncharacterized protein n=1 Tax=Catharanthus roseus TaxID=4058 RepID=A0ACC0B8P6_CATRO|nr:hypothetical protein M9H77_18862 [Catharanthus roseus]